MRRLAVLGRDATIDAAAVRATLDREPVVPATGDLGDAVRDWLDRLAAASPDALEDGTLYDRLVAEAGGALIAAMLARHGGNQLRTAQALGINRNTLRKRLDEAAGRAATGD